ncbi:MAG TPA: hypothetical protein DCG75_03625 [Bacteroidales bacterium]|nr:hypothetical protein [Bacteroidales bacterium]
MKKIKINQISKENNKYKVFIDSDHKYYFTSEKKAVKFQNEVNQYLTESLFQLNDLYIDLFTVYRRVYFVVENSLLKRSLDQALNNINHFIENSLLRSNYQSIGSSLVMTSINQIYDNLLNGYQTVRSITSKKNDTSMIYHVNNKIKILTVLFMEFEKFQLDLSKNDLENIQVKIIKIA